jgi:hypothetical protein
MGIGRNEYIEMMNRSKTGKGIFRKRVAPKLLLPTQPVCACAHACMSLCVCVLLTTIVIDRHTPSPSPAAAPPISPTAATKQAGAVVVCQRCPHC